MTGRKDLAVWFTLHLRLSFHVFNGDNLVFILNLVLNRKPFALVELHGVDCLSLQTLGTFLPHLVLRHRTVEIGVGDLLF